MTQTRDSERVVPVLFVVESGTDARLVEGLSARVDLEVFARAIRGGRAISQPTGARVTVATAGRAAFAWAVFRRVLRGPVTEVVLVQGYGLAALAANLAARLRGRPCWMLVCSPAAEYYAARRRAGQSYSAAALTAIEALACLNGRLGRGFIVLSGYLRDVVRRYAPSTPVQIIPVYGVDVRRFAERPDRAALRTGRGLPSSGRIIFSSSRVAPEKDSRTLIAAFATLVAEGRDVYLLHRSGGYEEFSREAASAGVSARVIATGAVDPRADLALDYLASDVCVQASREEGLGFSVLESLACGTPVVVSAVGGLVETVRDGETGWTVPAEDPAALASALRDVLDRPEEGRRRAEAGRRMVRERFESDMVFSRLADVLGGAVPR